MTGTTLGSAVARNASAVLRASLIAGAVYLMWDDFLDDCDYWLPTWGTLEGTARLFQSIILGLIVGPFITVMVVSLYRGLS